MNKAKIEKIQRLLNSAYKNIEKLTPVEWAEKYRYLTEDITDYPGRMSYSMTPYLKEIVNSILSSDPSQIIAIMKGSQLGFSIGGLFTILGWIISQSPSKVLFITETEEKVKDQMQNPINQMINSSGLSHLVGSNNQRERDAKGAVRRSVGSGDTLKGLKFNRGYLYTWSGQKIQSLSSWSAKYGLYDEVELYKGNYEQSGSFLKLIEPRHRSYGNRRKLFFVSTPLMELTSNIEPIYNKGDRRKYHIPCPHCGEMIEILWSVEVNGEYAGVTYQRDELGKYIEGSTGYICQKCGKFFKERHKYDCYEDDLGEWHPTATPESFIYKSFQISALYAPLGFYSWEHCARDWVGMHPKDSPKLINEIQTFYNQTLGLTWKEEAKTVDSKGLSKNCRNYMFGTVPYNLSMADGNGEIVMLACTVDLNGKMGESIEDDDVRLDYEVVAWCKRGGDQFVSCYSVDHGSIGTFERARHIERNEKKGIVKNDTKKWTYRAGYENSVFEYFDNEIMGREWLTEDGKPFRIVMCGVDVGNFTVYANDYVAKTRLAVALKGSEGARYITPDKSLYRKGNAKNLYIVNGTIVKDRLASIIELPWKESDKTTQPIGYKNFPLPNIDANKYTYQDYFIEYEGEEKKIKKDSKGNVTGMIWERIGDKRNHYWDCAAYNLVIKDIAVNIVCTNEKINPTWENFCNILLK